LYDLPNKEATYKQINQYLVGNGKEIKEKEKIKARITDAKRTYKDNPYLPNSVRKDGREVFEIIRGKGLRLNV
jgi:hypothetical protein